MYADYDDLQFRRLRPLSPRVDSLPRESQGGLFHRIAEAFSRWRRRRATREELDELDDRALADIGMARADVPYAASVEPLAPVPAHDQPIVPAPDEHEADEFARERERARREFADKAF